MATPPTKNSENNCSEYYIETEINSTPTSSVKKTIISFLLGNILSFIVGSLVYLNYVLFESYIGVIFYGFLFSEALWDTKQQLVRYIERLNDTDVSPRQIIIDFFQHLSFSGVIHFYKSIIILEQYTLFSLIYSVIWFISSIMFVIFISFGCILRPELMFASFISIMIAIAFIYVLDKRILIVTRLHRCLLQDDTLVALILISSLLVFIVVFMSTFFVLSLREAMNALVVFQNYIDNAIRDESAKDMYDSIAFNGQIAVENWIQELEMQYNHTAWQPLLQSMVTFYQLNKHKLSEYNTNSFAQTDNCFNMNPIEHHLVEQQQDDDAIGFVGYLSKWNTVQSPFYDLLPSWAVNKTVKEIIIIFYSQPGELYTQPTEIYTESFAELLAHLKSILLTSYVGLLHGFGVFFNVLFSFIDFGIRVVFLFTIMFLLLSSKENIIHSFLSGLLANYSSDDEPKFEHKGNLNNFEYQLRSTIEGVLMLPVKMTLAHTLATFLIFWLFMMEFKFLASSFSMFFTIFPVVYPYLICVPWCISCFLQGAYAKAFFLFFSHYITFSSIDDYVLNGFQSTRTKSNSIESHKITQSEEDFVRKRSYITGISVFFGVSAFGVGGVLLGPLLVCLVIVLYDSVSYHLNYSDSSSFYSASQSTQLPRKSEEKLNRNPVKFPKKRRNTLDLGKVSGFENNNQGQGDLKRHRSLSSTEATTGSSGAVVGRAGRLIWDQVIDFVTTTSPKQRRTSSNSSSEKTPRQEKKSNSVMKQTSSPAFKKTASSTMPLSPASGSIRRRVSMTKRSSEDLTNLCETNYVQKLKQASELISLGLISEEEYELIKSHILRELKA